MKSKNILQSHSSALYDKRELFRSECATYMHCISYMCHTVIIFVVPLVPTGNMLGTIRTRDEHQYQSDRSKICDHLHGCSKIVY